MSTQHDPHDEQRHRNLQRIAAVLELPPRAEPDRRTRWEQASLTAGARPGSKGASFMRRKAYTLTASAAAAAILLALSITIAKPARVSAATIFENLAAALSESLALEIENVDFGNVRIDGEILIDRNAPGDAATRYAEIHALLRSDNPQWDDYDGVLVICDAPDGAWQFCRGTGISTTGLNQFKATENFSAESNWEDFIAAPVEGFLPNGMRITAEGSTVRFAFTEEQRSTIQALLQFLLNLTGERTAQELVLDLQAAAGQVEVERLGSGMFMLRASGFTRLGNFILEPPEIPDVSELVRQIQWRLYYDPTINFLYGWGIDKPPRALVESGVDIVTDREALALPTESLEALLAYLRATAKHIEVQRESDARVVIEIRGYPFPTSAADLEWLRSYILQLRESLVLEVMFDAAAGRVTSAEFRGFTGPESRVRLKTGDVTIDPARLDPARWVSP